jgi:hypothetical protein
MKVFIRLSLKRPKIIKRKKSFKKLVKTFRPVLENFYGRNYFLTIVSCSCSWHFQPSLIFAYKSMRMSCSPSANVINLLTVVSYEFL